LGCHAQKSLRILSHRLVLYKHILCWHGICCILYIVSTIVLVSSNIMGIPSIFDCFVVVFVFLTLFG
jgi:hypothetical protein